MGKPKKIRKRYESPKRPFDDLERDRALMKEFGLSTKREIWRVETELRKIRRRARELQALKEGHSGQLKEEKELLDKLNRIGLEAAKLDDVLRLSVTDLLSRRLQTIVYKKGMGSSIKGARQLIVHGHVFIGDTKVKFPAMIVTRADEENIKADLAAEKAHKTAVQAEKLAEQDAAQEPAEKGESNE